MWRLLLWNGLLGFKTGRVKSRPWWTGDLLELTLISYITNNEYRRLRMAAGHPSSASRGLWESAWGSVGTKAYHTSERCPGLLAVRSGCPPKGPSRPSPSRRGDPSCGLTCLSISPNPLSPLNSGWFFQNDKSTHRTSRVKALQRFLTASRKKSKL